MGEKMTGELGGIRGFSPVLSSILESFMAWVPEVKAVTAEPWQDLEGKTIIYVWTHRRLNWRSSAHVWINHGSDPVGWLVVDTSIFGGIPLDFSKAIYKKKVQPVPGLMQANDD